MPPLFGEGGGLVCESVGKADLLSDHFYSKQSSESVATHLPSISCHPVTFAFRKNDDRRLLLKSDPVV